MWQRPSIIWFTTQGLLYFFELNMGNKHQPELPEMVFLLSHGNQKRKDFNNAVQKKFLLISKTKENYVYQMVQS